VLRSYSFDRRRSLCWWQQHQHYRLRRRRRSSHKNSTDFAFFAYFSFSTSTWKYSNDFLTASNLIWLFIDRHCSRSPWYPRKLKTCRASAGETFKLTYCRLFKNGFLGYRFWHNNNETYKSKPVYFGGIFSQLLFVNCWKRTQFWRATKVWHIGL